MSSDGDNTPAKHRGLKEPWKPGESPNPNGRPKGARNKLGEAFLEALHDDFQANGQTAITTMRADDPSGYVRVIASLLPKEVKIETVNDLSDEQLDARIRQLASILEIGVSGPSDGATAQAESKPSRKVSPLH